VPDAAAPRPNLNTYWVIPGKFLAGEYPGDKELVKAREKIHRFLEVGVRHFVDLTEFGELVPYEAILSDESRAANVTATYQRFPTRDVSVPRDAAYLGEILFAIVGSGKEVSSMCNVGAEWDAPVWWSHAGCKSTAERRTMPWSSCVGNGARLRRVLENRNRPKRQNR
jgi:hypothetical protein